MPYSLREFSWSERKKSSIQILGKVQSDFLQEGYLFMVSIPKCGEEYIRRQKQSDTKHYNSTSM